MKYLVAAFAMLVPFAADAAGDTQQGAIVFKKCAACNSVDQPRNKIGPDLVGIIGRHAASVADFSYSDSMKKAGADGLVWNEQTLSQYLAAPKKFVPGKQDDLHWPFKSAGYRERR
jgi:cytochrome c